MIEGWKETTLGEVAEIVKDQWLPGDADQKYIGLEHINQGDLQINGFGCSSSLQSNKFYFKQGDILFGKLRPYFRKVWKARFDGVCSTDIWVLRAKEGYDQNYLFYFMANPVFIDKSTGASIGTKMPRADWDFLKRSKWLFPPLSEQRAIAAVLSSFDDKIELLRRQNKTLEAIAQAIFKEWFVKFKVKGEQLKLNPKTGLPEGWTQKGLDEIADFLNGLALQKYPPENEEDVLPVVKIRELKSGITDQTDKASKRINPEYIVDNGDVLFSWSGSLEVVLWSYGKGALNQHLFKVTSKKYPKWFYYYWIMEHLPFFKSIAEAKATTMGHIQRHHLAEAKVAIPHNDFMTFANSKIKPVFEHIVLNNSQIQTLSKLRDTLLPKLMKGEIRVKREE